MKVCIIFSAMYSLLSITLNTILLFLLTLLPEGILKDFRPLESHQPPPATRKTRTGSNYWGIDLIKKLVTCKSCHSKVRVFWLGSRGQVTYFSQWNASKFRKKSLLIAWCSGRGVCLPLRGFKSHGATLVFIQDRFSTQIALFASVTSHT